MDALIDDLICGAVDKKDVPLTQVTTKRAKIKENSALKL